MKLTVVLVLLGILSVSAKTYSQNVTIDGTNLSLKKVFTTIRKQTGYAFVFDKEIIEKAKPVTLHVTNMPLAEVLRRILSPQEFEYEITNGTIGIRMRPTPVVSQQTTVIADRLPIKGLIMDSLGRPLEGANIVIKATGKFARSDEQGHFTIEAEIGQTLTVSFVGFRSQEIKITQDKSYTIILQQVAKGMNEVVISTGVVQRMKETFTGATAVYSGDEIRKIGNKSLITSLKTLDPSFIIIDNNAQGSNPNALPSIEIRGKTSIASTEQLNDQFSQDPNQPLFILNGFETTLEVIYNLDINRVASVNILKDAASTALYGSRAANGVVVVETIRAKGGQLQIGYTTGVNITTPDLGSYNLMNAEEKLEFERLTGVYGGSRLTQYEYDQLYNAKLSEVRKGVNTYWLKAPLRTGIANNHSLRFSGGSNELQFGAGASYTFINGPMKGSDKKTWSANMDVSYRKKKVNVMNTFMVNGVKNDDSPYGSFSAFARANPYYKMRDENGAISPFLSIDGISFEKLGYKPVNPLYEGTLNSFSGSRNFNIQNSLAVNWDVLPGLQISASGQLANTRVELTSFKAPESADFDGWNMFQKGRYINGNTNATTYQGFLSATFARLFYERHQLSVTARGEIGESSTRTKSFTAVGFPFGTNGNPSYAYSYPEGGRPSAASLIKRNSGGVITASYSYRLRYLFDATYRINGSTNFGAASKYNDFWSIGAGWNLHHEDFMNNVKWINSLRLRGNVGVVGNENMGIYSSTSVYTFMQGSNRYGQGLDMTSLGNPFLQWQNTRTESVGTDIVLFNQRLSIEVNYFQKRTDPLIVKAEGTLPSSVGIPGSYPVNVGQLDGKGWEFNVKYSPIQNLSKRIIWSIGARGANTKQVFRGLGNALEKLNDAQQNTKGLIRYTDGNSPDDLWAVRSLGIDPATGYEIYYNKSGDITYTYNADDVVKIGNSRPKLEGIVFTSFSFKGFSCAINMRYRIGGYTMNTALFEKVENTDATTLQNNQDRRALYDRWKQPGDITQFKAIDNRAAQLGNSNDTPISSRFIQKNSHWVGESLNAQYSFRSADWIKAVGLKNLSLGFSMNELFRFEKMQTERGTDYPFAREFAFTLNASF